ncbi:phytoene/squalene synthase family protein [Leifsonia aquatica]|uniref:Phytoene/squalene synthetase n=2 Tax=Leifsonia aquatica TaxID=144185 RepID=U2RW09_LEIAQ|nr:squalene/phytoene synthase family protein [Leifsonia aquatica]ERK72714.1 phytoene/squalene synthetase [Leifsonia aquatica ATCC 14665]MBB2966820.1 phytoene/squalene synthetase [Leifsonia aquatica]
MTRTPVASTPSASAQPTDLALYTRAAHAGAATIIREYSTSFGMATRLLGAEVRPRVEDVYSLVRVADEIVDGAAAEAGLSVADQRDLLDALEADTERAMRTGYSANVVVHSFASTARASGFGAELTRPFFASMRRDLSPVDFTAEELSAYIYGSAEVIGLMCLSAFLAGRPVADETRRRLEIGAQRLGSAFQKINFLRDLAVDYAELGRSYFPGIDPSRLTERQKLALVVDIDCDLGAAADVIPELPDNCRRAVLAAHGLFAELSDRIRSTPAEELLTRRVSVPTRTKLAILVRAGAGSRR